MGDLHRAGSVTHGSSEVEVMVHGSGRSVPEGHGRHEEERNLECDFLDVYEDFLATDGSILDIDVNFMGDLYLSPQGIRIIRACWLRHFGFFPPKGGK